MVLRMIVKIIVKIKKLLIKPEMFAKTLGVTLGKNCRLIGNVEFGSEPYLVKIGDHVSVTNSMFITHDGGVWVFRDEMPDLDVIKPINVGDNVFIGANCVILPGVNIGSNVVIGACSLVTQDVPSNSVFGGVPAKKIKELAEYQEKTYREGIQTKQLSRIQKMNFLKNKFDV